MVAIELTTAWHGAKYKANDIKYHLHLIMHQTIGLTGHIGLAVTDYWTNGISD